MRYWIWFQHFLRIESGVLLVLAVLVWGFIVLTTEGRTVGGSLFLLGIIWFCTLAIFLLLSMPVGLVVWILAG